MQSQTKNKTFIVLDKYHQILLNENMKAAPNKSHFFLTCVIFLGHIIERNTIIPLKFRIDEIRKLQPSSNKKSSILPLSQATKNFLLDDSISETI